MSLIAFVVAVVALVWLSLLIVNRLITEPTPNLLLTCLIAAVGIALIGHRIGYF